MKKVSSLIKYTIGTEKPKLLRKYWPGTKSV